ncbi:hypothetical protein AKJ51_01505 [candidate division MSBL1 archaeon SCGC-AAA382A20]|uniref:Periplasmic copper-binding protein NosD beta helix domain-containing protein n=1 Tax=candidate division MSBL1 archaeon SCGC-AAA382A20 TaxID=1698280 RepID=A0A133VLW3_9EURY|nr:hypothetical protein AKJ51_01505 [candidate division MSBL1 archaeon SCGC-AAA382A20]
MEMVTMTNFRKFLIFVLIAFLFIPLIPNNISEAKSIPSNPTYTLHAPIRINNNSDLQSESSSGNGTEGNPCIIEGYEINGTGVGYCLYIGNTTDYFTVNNSYFHNASGNTNTYFNNVGLYFYNVTNGTICNSMIKSNVNQGIRFTSSVNNTISSNNIDKNTVNGIVLLQQSDNNNIRNNNVSNGGSDPSHSGLYVDSSDNNSINGNIFFKNQGMHIDLSTTSFCYVKNNSFYYSLKQILIFNSDNIVINESIFLNASGVNARNVNIINSTNVIVRNSTFKSSEKDGIWIGTNSEYVTICFNNFELGVDTGVCFSSGDNCTIYNNTFRSKIRSVSITDSNSQSNVVYHNRFYSECIDYGPDNIWNLSYPSGGNFWYDYMGEDKFTGINQNVVGRDNIGDIPYSYNDVKDYYPLFPDWENYDFVRETIPPNNKSSVHVDQDISVVFIGTMNTSKDISLYIPGNYSNVQFQGWTSTYKTNDTATFTHNNLHFSTDHKPTVTFLGNETYSWQYTTESFGEYVTRIVSPVAISIFVVVALFVSIKIIISAFNGKEKGDDLYD